MAETMDYDGIVRMITGAVASIRAHHEHLSQLDTAIGDGDHGSAMMRSMDAVEKALSEADGSDAKSMLYNVGWGVMSAAGGAPGPLLGSFFMGLSEGVAGRAELDCAALAAAFEAGLAGMQKQSKAQPGDKTMMDALVPAVEALRAAAGASKGIDEAMADAADAAARGAEATKDMLAKFGKARNMGERTLGHADAGATSISYIFRGFADALKAHGPATPKLREGG